MRHKKTTGLILAGLAVLLLTGSYAWAHCDGVDGPVVKAAEKALATNNINYALVWVDAKSDPELRSVFQQAVALRSSPEARALADRHFFETLVRLHRLGEGAPYTGLKPAGRDLGPAIPAADYAVESGDIDALEKLLVKELRAGLRSSFERVKDRRKYDANDISAGREYVKSYVEYIHFVERLHEAASGGTAGHYGEIDSH